MSTEKGIVTRTSLQDIADGIRYANGANAVYKPEEMGEAIRALKKTLGTKNITANGNYNASTDSLDGYSSVNVAVHPNLQSKTVTHNGTVTPDAGYDGLSSVIVDVSGGGEAFAYALCHGTTGTTVTATDGVTTLFGTILGGRVLLAIPYSGTWTFTNEGVTVQKSITTQGEMLEVSFIFVIHQDNTPSGAVFTYANEGRKMIVLWPFSANHEGLVFDTVGYTSINMVKASQAGISTNTATLPDITDNGTGRVRYSTNFPSQFKKSATEYFFAVFYTKTIGATVALEVEVVS